MIDVNNLSVDYCGGSSFIEIYNMNIFQGLDLCSDIIHLYNIVSSNNDSNINIVGINEVIIEFGEQFSGSFDILSQNFEIVNDVSYYILKLL